MPGTESWLRCRDGQAVLLWPKGISLDEWLSVHPRLKVCSTLEDVRRCIPELQQALGKEVRAAYFPHFGELKRAA